MGLFNFFKKDKKAEIIATDNGLLGPTYFEGLTQQVNDARRIEIFEWRGKLISNSGNTKFRIKYYGQLHSNYDTLIVAIEFAPALVVAQDIVSGQEILLFDGCKHGYDAMFCDEYSLDQIKNRPTNNLFKDKEDNESFEIILSAYYQINFDDDEEDFLEQVDRMGFIELIDKTKMKFEDAKRNAFDVFQIVAINDKGKKIEIISEELA